jgi:oxygen-independent coproporphyrinogen-3 oxidase
MPVATPAAGAAELPEALLRKLDRPGPRYTSYPTADRFVETFGADDYRRALVQRAQGAAGPMSLYVHLPFCESVCYYCACNKVVTRHHERAGEYLQALAVEVQLHAALLGRRQAVAQLHLGGGTPTFLSDAELERLLNLLHGNFALARDAECSIEVDPRTVDARRLRRLAALGFNRLSFGVQDFDPDVQRAVHRVQPFEAVHTLMHAAREAGLRSINVDLIYGLPQQTPASFGRTIAQVVALRPDRIALYAYAHLPQRFKAQRRIDVAALPAPAERVAMLGSAIDGFLRHGYRHIGMDHFALPHDALAQAKRAGTLHRNFQGYSTQPDCDLVGLGVSAIGHIGEHYAQNAKTLAEYYGAMQRGEFATQRGLAATPDDRVRRAVIMALMCQGRVDFGAIAQAHGIEPRSYLRSELQQLQPWADDGVLTLAHDTIELTPRGWYAVRAVAMLFDRHLQAGRPRERFSRVV